MRGQRQGRYGFHRPNAKKIDVINVGVLDQMVGEDGRIDLSGKKVLGDGRITRKLIVSAANFSRSAKEKIEAAGGEVVVT
jgi:Ribosomal protein L18E